MEGSARSDLDSSSDTTRAENISLPKHQGQCSQVRKEPDSRRIRSSGVVKALKLKILAADELIQKYKQLKQRHEKLYNLFKYQEKQIVDLEQLNREQQKTIDKLNTEMRKEVAGNKGFENTISQLIARLDEAEKQQEDAGVKLKEAEESRNQLKKCMSEKNKQIDRLERKVERLKASPKGRRKSRKSSVADSGFFDVTPLTPPLDPQDVSTLAKDPTEVMTDSVDDQTASEFEDKPVVDDEELPITMDTSPSMPPYDCGDVDSIADDNSGVQLLSMPALLCTSSHTSTHVSSQPPRTAPRTHGPPQSPDLSSTEVRVNKKQPRESFCTSVSAQASRLEAICSGSGDNGKDSHIDICATNGNSTQGNTGEKSQSKDIIPRNTEHTKSRCSGTQENSRELEDEVCLETNKSLCLSPQQQFEDTLQAESCELQIPGFADFELLSDTSDSDDEITTDEESVLTSSGTIAGTNTVTPIPASFQPIMEVDLDCSSGEPIDLKTGAENLADSEMGPEKTFILESSGVSKSSTTLKESRSFGTNEGESNTPLSRKEDLEANVDNICQHSSQSLSHPSHLLEDSIMAEVAAITSHPILGLSTPLGPLPPSPVHMVHSLHRVPVKDTTSQDLEDCKLSENTPSKPKSEKGGKRSRKVCQKQSKSPPLDVCNSISIPMRPRKCRGVVIPSSPLVRTTAFEGAKLPRDQIGHSKEDCRNNSDHIASPTPVRTSTTGVPTTRESTTSVPTARESTTGVPTTRESTTGVPTARESTTGVPTARESTTSVPTTRESTTGVPTARESTTGMPTTRDSTTGVSTTGVPTTRESTTGVPTTRESTTGVPTARESTTGVPTARESTTGVPTARESTTGVPTARDSTTGVPTTRDSTTGVPTTDGLAPVSLGDSFSSQEVLNTSVKTDLAQCCPIGIAQLENTQMEEGSPLHCTQSDQVLNPDTTHISNQTSKPNYGQTSKPDNTQTSKPDDNQTSKPDNNQTSKPNDTQTSKPDDNQTSKLDNSQTPDQAGANLHMSEQCTMGNNQAAPQWSESCTNSRVPLEEGVIVSSDLEDGEIDDDISTLDHLSPATNHCPDVLAPRPGDKRPQLPAGGPPCQLPPKKQPKMPSPQAQDLQLVPISWLDPLIEQSSHEKTVKKKICTKRGKSQKEVKYVVANLGRLQKNEHQVENVLKIFSLPSNLRNSTSFVKGLRTFLLEYKPLWKDLQSILKARLDVVLSKSVAKRKDSPPMSSDEDPKSPCFNPCLLPFEARLVWLVVQLSRNNPQMQHSTSGSHLVVDVKEMLYMLIKETSAQFHLCCALVRLYVCCCRLMTGALEHVQLLCCELMSRPGALEKKIQVLPLLQSVASVWPLALTRSHDCAQLQKNKHYSPSLLEKDLLTHIPEVIVAHIFWRDDPEGFKNMVYKSLYLFCGWRQLTKDTLQQATLGMVKILQTSSNVSVVRVQQLSGPPQLNPLAERILSLLSLSCNVLGWQWTSDVLIRREFWPVLQAWNKKDQLQPVKEVTVVCICKFIGMISSLGVGFECVSLRRVNPLQQLINLLISLVKKSKDNKDVTIPIQLAAVNSLLTLCCHDNSTPAVAKGVLLTWLQQIKSLKAVPDNILAPYAVAIGKFNSDQLVQFCESTY